MSAPNVTEEPFPAPTRQASGTIGGVPTEASAISFEDKIMVTLSQEGRLSQWIQVPLAPPSPAHADMSLPSASLLPLSHLTAKTLLGGGGEERESLAQLYAVQIASHISRRNPEESRMLTVGMGIRDLKPDREAFFDVIELIQKVL